jgi:hypothetical protein
MHVQGHGNEGVRQDEQAGGGGAVYAGCCECYEEAVRADTRESRGTNGLVG